MHDLAEMNASGFEFFIHFLFRFSGSEDSGAVGAPGDVLARVGKKKFLRNSLLVFLEIPQIGRFQRLAVFFHGYCPRRGCPHPP